MMLGLRGAAHRAYQAAHVEGHHPGILAGVALDELVVASGVAAAVEGSIGAARLDVPRRRIVEPAPLRGARGEAAGVGVVLQGTRPTRDGLALRGVVPCT